VLFALKSKNHDSGTGGNLFIELRTASLISVRANFGLYSADTRVNVDKMRSRSVGGTGLGLAIVKHILEAHGTTMIVNSECNIGSEFSFKLKK